MLMFLIVLRLQPQIVLNCSYFYERFCLKNKIQDRNKVSHLRNFSTTCIIWDNNFVINELNEFQSSFILTNVHSY